jgi:transposase
MATSTSDSPNSIPNAPSAPREETLPDVAALTRAIDEILGYAKTQVQVFDVDLSTLGWNNPARIETLSRLLFGSRAARIDIIVHDTRWIEAKGARLMQLFRQFPHAMAVHRTRPEAQSAMNPLVIVDRVHCVHRFHADQPRGALMVASPAQIKPLAVRFDELWNASEPGLAGSTLGL